MYVCMYVCMWCPCVLTSILLRGSSYSSSSVSLSFFIFSSVSPSLPLLFPSNPLPSPPLPSPPLPCPPLPQPQQVQQALCYRRAAFEQLVGGILHKTQTWFHGNLSREESETLLRRFGLKDGTFLVRERVDANSYAICVAHNQRIYHYLLERNNDGLLSIQKGRKFENLLQVR